MGFQQCQWEDEFSIYNLQEGRGLTESLHDAKRKKKVANSIQENLTLCGITNKRKERVSKNPTKVQPVSHHRKGFGGTKGQIKNNLGASSTRKQVCRV